MRRGGSLDLKQAFDDAAGALELKEEATFKGGRWGREGWGHPKMGTYLTFIPGYQKYRAWRLGTPSRAGLPLMCGLRKVYDV